MTVKSSLGRRFLLHLKKYYQLYLLALPAVLYLFIFNYIPMYGAQIAFRDYKAAAGITGSQWVGLKHFSRFLGSHQFKRVFSNTLILSFQQLVISFPFPILLALMLNQVSSRFFKKTVQTVTYAPHFISIVVLVGMLNLFLSPNTGLVNTVVKQMGGEPVFFMGTPEWFRPIYILSSIWQSTGWGSVIYLATLSSVDPGLYEAARIDGCSRFGLIRYVDLPALAPTIVMMLIMSLGTIMDIGFQKAFLMQNPLNAATSQIISTYVYEVGLMDAQFSYSTAIGLFNSVINVVMLLIVNKAAKKLSGTGLW